MIKDRMKRFIAQRDRAEAKARALELANARLKAQVERMQPVVDAANGWLSGSGGGAELKQAIEAYRERKAQGRRALDRDEIAELMVRALYLYPHYRVDSRGPRGCIWDVLTAVAPDVAAEIEDSDAATVYNRRWGER